MTPEETSLARLLVALPGWTWRGGTAWISDTDCPLCHGAGGFRWHEADGSENGESCPCSGRIDGSRKWTGAIPDLLDPAGSTAGILLGMLHAVSRGVVSVTWYHLGAMTICGNPAWGVSCLADGQSERINTEGEHLGVAVARALLAIGRAS